MGRISQGVYGGLSGKTGNLIGGSWKGITYLRIKPSSVANPRTEGQLAQRLRFTTALQFLQPLRDFVDIGYKQYAVKMSGFNKAMSTVLKEAIIGVYPAYEIEYDSALLSRGSLPPAINVNASSSAPGEVTVTWDDNSLNGTASPTDKSMIALYNPLQNEAVTLFDGATRDFGEQALTVPNNYSGNQLEAYISFQSADGSSVSNSLYIGSVVVA